MTERIDNESLDALLARLADECLASPEELAAYEAEQRRQRIFGLRCPLAIERALLVGRDEHGFELRETDSERRLAAARRKGKRLVVLQGPPGTGKTMAVARALVEDERARWVTTTEYCRFAPWDPALDGFRYVPVLGLDDLGVEHTHDRKKIEQLIYERHAEGRTTWCTTNLTPDQFKAAYDSRVVSRLGEVGQWCQCAEVVRPGPKQHRLKLVQEEQRK